MATEINDRMEIRTTKITGAHEWETEKKCDAIERPTTTICNELIAANENLSEASEVAYAILRFLAGDDNAKTAKPINDNIASLLQNSISVKEKSSYLCVVLHEIGCCIGML